MASNKLRSLSSQPDEELKMDMSPMIDMVFLLLIFFIVVSTPKVVKMDAEVKPSVAYNAADPKAKDGRIVVNVREDGTVLDIESNILESEEDIAEYVRGLKERTVSLGYVPRLHLRGDKRASFKHSRKVIKAASTVGVEKVIFSAYNFE